MFITLVLIGRFLLGAYFLQAGIRNFMNMPVHIGILTKKNIPMPRESLIVALAVQTIGGAMVAFGIFPAIGAVGLILFTIAANALYHNFTQFTGAERMTHLGSVLSNLAIIGGLLIVVAL